MKRLLQLDWDAVAGILAAVTALVMHFLHVIEADVSCIVSDIGAEGKTECVVSFWGEPFMSRSTDRDVPRYIFHVQSHSDLVGRLVDLVRQHRLAG